MSERDDYRRVAQKKMQTLEAKIDLLKAEGSEAGAGARLAINERIRDAEQALAEGQSALGKLVDLGEDEWEEMKGRLESFRGRVQGVIDALGGDDEEKKS